LKAKDGYTQRGGIFLHKPITRFQEMCDIRLLLPEKGSLYRNGGIPSYLEERTVRALAGTRGVSMRVKIKAPSLRGKKKKNAGTFPNKKT